MIIDTLDQRHKYASDPGLAAALDALAALDATAAPGTLLDLGDKVGHVSIAEFTSQDHASKTEFEAHRQFADIHVVLAGEERIDIATLRSLSPTTPFDESADIGFHTGPANVTVRLQPGWFIVCYPTDAHRPGLCLTEPDRVLKAVAKLRLR